MNDLVIHSQDVQATVNALWRSGAEAVSINGQRLVGTSAVLCVGNTLLLHGLRHLGLMFLAPGAIYIGLPRQFAYPAALGDLLAAVLAVIAIPAVAANRSSAKPLVWIFNIEGTVDLALAIALATIYAAGPHMGPAYWIPAFWVPALLVTHYLTFVILLKHWR